MHSPMTPEERAAAVLLSNVLHLRDEGKSAPEAICQIIHDMKPSQGTLNIFARLMLTKVVDTAKDRPLRDSVRIYDI